MVLHPTILLQNLAKYLKTTEENLQKKIYIPALLQTDHSHNNIMVLKIL